MTKACMIITVGHEGFGMAKSVLKTENAESASMDRMYQENRLEVPPAIR